MRTDTLKFSKSLCEYFANIGSKISQKLPCSDAFSFKIYSKSCMHSFMLHEITPKEVSNCISNIKPYYSPGMDGIPPKFDKLASCMQKLPLSQNHSNHMRRWVLLLMGSTNLQSLLSILKEFPHFLECCSQLNPCRILWYLNFSHASSEWSAKILCLPEWLESNQRPNSSQLLVVWTLLTALQLFVSRNAGNANQIMTCFATRP